MRLLCYWTIIRRAQMNGHHCQVSTVDHDVEDGTGATSAHSADAAPLSMYSSHRWRHAFGRAEQLAHSMSGPSSGAAVQQVLAHVEGQLCTGTRRWYDGCGGGPMPDNGCSRWRRRTRWTLNHWRICWCGTWVRLASSARAIRSGYRLRSNVRPSSFSWVTVNWGRVRGQSPGWENNSV